MEVVLRVAVEVASGSVQGGEGTSDVSDGDWMTCGSRGRLRLLAIREAKCETDGEWEERRKRNRTWQS